VAAGMHGRHLGISPFKNLDAPPPSRTSRIASQDREP
jgi:hypothetical protein